MEPFLLVWIDSVVISGDIYGKFVLYVVLLGHCDQKREFSQGVLAILELHSKTHEAVGRRGYLKS